MKTLRNICKFALQSKGNSMSEEGKNDITKPEETPTPEEKKTEAVLTIADLEAKLKSLKKVKDTIETNYYQILGQINLVSQQIDELHSKERKTK